MKKILMAILLSALLFGCDNTSDNKTALQEQALTEINQQNLLSVQPPPKISWSLERDNLIKRFKLQNDRSVMFYMYIFIEGVSEPVGYYQVNKISSVNSQLTNTMQLVEGRSAGYIETISLPSPSEDGSYGTNGEAVFGFTPNDIYIEHNMHYIVSTVPLAFDKPRLLTVISLKDEGDLKALMMKLN